MFRQSLHFFCAHLGTQIEANGENINTQSILSLLIPSFIGPSGDGEIGDVEIQTLPSIDVAESVQACTSPPDAVTITFNAENNVSPTFSSWTVSYGL